MDTDHLLPIHLAAQLDAGTTEAALGMPANLYRTANYVVIDVGLPRCLPAHIRVSLAPGALLVEADRHPGELATDQGRDYVLHELPHGTVRRTIELPAADLLLAAAEAHFANGMLTVSIPTAGREEYRRNVRGEVDEPGG